MVTRIKIPTGTKSTTVSYINGSSTAQGDNQHTVLELCMVR